mmetsp:Transcript_14154/g.35104  ORF Transcript_14154/g.35104 Transcript_14154/m.35104 type:complete len:231 (-) Transcript_14154:1844-2536(-)
MWRISSFPAGLSHPSSSNCTRDILVISTKGPTSGSRLKLECCRSIVSRRELKHLPEGGPRTCSSTLSSGTGFFFLIASCAICAYCTRARVSSANVASEGRISKITLMLPGRNPRTFIRDGSTSQAAASARENLVARTGSENRCTSSIARSCSVSCAKILSLFPSLACPSSVVARGWPRREVACVWIACAVPASMCVTSSAICAASMGSADFRVSKLPRSSVCCSPACFCE